MSTKNIDKIIDDITDRYVQKFKTDTRKALNYTAEEIYKDAITTFDKCIDQFYVYETQSYYRHEVGRGTRNGINLYRANNTRIDYSGRSINGIYVGWNGKDMSPYKPLSVGKGDNKKIVNVSTEHVLDSVMNGIRFNGDGKNNGYFPSMKWNLFSPIKTTHFGTLSGETPNKIFDIFESKADDVMVKIFNQKYNSLKNKKR